MSRVASYLLCGVKQGLGLIKSFSTHQNFIIDSYARDASLLARFSTYFGITASFYFLWLMYEKLKPLIQ